jgi:phage virion morphogenesis protein
MYRVTVTTDELSAALARVQAALTDTSPLMQDIGEFMQRSTKANFDAGTDPDGNAWAPRSPVTLARYEKNKDKPGPRPLIGPSKSLSTTISYEAEADEVSWGSNMIYAAVMQFGAQQGEFGARMGSNKKGRRYFFPIPWGNIPARPYLGIGTADQQAIGEIIAEYLGDAAGD